MIDESDESFARSKEACRAINRAVDEAGCNVPEGLRALALTFFAAAFTHNVSEELISEILEKSRLVAERADAKVRARS